MENQGWISLHRKLLDNPISKKPNYLSVWIFILLSCNHRDTEVIWNNKKTPIKRGQFIGSISKIAIHLGLSTGTVSNILDYLISESMIEKSSNYRFTLFTVKNYDVYQSGVESSSESKLKASRKQLETNNNDNNENNDNKYKSLKLFKANKDKVISKAKEKYEGKNCELAYEHFVNYCDYKKTNYKDHYIAYLTWIRKDLDNAYGGKITNQTERDEGERRRQATRELLDGRSSLVKAKKM